MRGKNTRFTDNLYFLNTHAYKTDLIYIYSWDIFISKGEMFDYFSTMTIISINACNKIVSTHKTRYVHSRIQFTFINGEYVSNNNGINFQNKCKFSYTLGLKIFVFLITSLMHIEGTSVVVRILYEKLKYIVLLSKAQLRKH